MCADGLWREEAIEKITQSVTWTQEQHKDTGREKWKQCSEAEGTGRATVQRHRGEVQGQREVERVYRGQVQGRGRSKQARQTVQRRTAL